MNNSSISTRISDIICEARQLLSRYAEQFPQFTSTSFNTEIVRVLGLSSIADYNSIIDCFYIFEDTELAKDYIRNNGLAAADEQHDFGLVYLKFYGLMNACYLQQQAVIVCNERLKLAIDLACVKTNPLIECRNNFAAHSPNRGGGRGNAEHSYILDRFGLLAGWVSGYSSNAPTGCTFKDAKLLDLLDEWDSSFVDALTPICQRIASSIRVAGVSEI